MARISSTPCSVPSSPGRPCSMLRATSGLTVVSTAAMSRPTSMRVTRWPRRESASAQALPERNEISRSADQPPIRTATCLLMLVGPTADSPRASIESRMGGTSRVRLFCRSDPLDLPFKLDVGILFDALAHGLAQIFELGGGGAAQIDEKIAVHL